MIVKVERVQVFTGTLHYDVSNQSKTFVEKFERESSLGARMGADTVAFFDMIWGLSGCHFGNRLPDQGW